LKNVSEPDREDEELGRNDEALAVMHQADLRSQVGSSTGWLACANIKAGRRWSHALGN
jgi:hypothetical protein